MGDVNDEAEQLSHSLEDAQRGPWSSQRRSGEIQDLEVPGNEEEET